MRNETIGQRVKRLRKERQLTQPQVGGPGASPSLVSKIEQGAREPTAAVLDVLAARLGVSRFYLEHGRADSVYVVVRFDDGGDVTELVGAFRDSKVADEIVGLAQESLGGHVRAIHLPIDDAEVRARFEKPKQEEVA